VTLRNGIERLFYNNMNAKKLGILSMKLFLNPYTCYTTT